MFGRQECVGRYSFLVLRYVLVLESKKDIIVMTRVVKDMIEIARLKRLKRLFIVT